MSDDAVSISISEEEVRIGDYYLRGKIPDKLAWLILLAVASAVGLGHGEITAILGGL